MEIERFLAEGHIQGARKALVKMAYGQILRIAHDPWGVAGSALVVIHKSEFRVSREATLCDSLGRKSQVR